MLGSTGGGGLVGSSGEGGTAANEITGVGDRGGGEAVVAVGSNTNNSSSSSIMSGGGIGDEEKGRGSGGGVVGDFFEGDRSTGGNRWPRQETIALLKIRSDMDGVFRDSSLKGPLWEEVSRKMAELGYHRSSKKCKEKFENVYKYHKRTKDGRVGKSDGKTYRFFDQLEALEQHHLSLSSPLPPLPPGTPRAQPTAHAAVPVTMVIPAGTNNPGVGSVTVTSSPHPISVVHTSGISITTSASTTPPQLLHQHHFATPMPQPQVMQQQHSHPHQHPSMPVHHSSPIQMENASSPSATPSSSSSTSSDEELLGRRKRKRKWKDFFERLMKEVTDKQEQLQKRFLETVEKREHDRLVREEAWKAQEIGRLNREHEILVQERSMAAAKDAALIAFLQKLSDQQQIPLSLPIQTTPIQSRVATATTTHTPPPPHPPPSQPQPQLQPTVSQTPPLQQTQAPPPQMQVTAVHLQENPVKLAAQAPPQGIPQPQPLTQIPPQQARQQALELGNTMMTTTTNVVDIHRSNNGSSGDSHHQASSSRWPKAEVQALIDLRTKLDQKYQESGPKGPLWEEISSSMKKLGYNRNAKRCKEKWENINKYFKKVKESNKKRPEDSKTCPYFHQLDALYREKTIRMDISPISPNNSNTSYNNSHPSSNNNNPGSYAPPPQSNKPENLNTMGPIMAQPQQQWHPQDHEMEDAGSDNDSDEDDGDDEDEDEQGSGGYEIVANNNSNNNAAVAGVINSMSVSTTATTTATAE